MTVEASGSVDVRNVCPKSGRECDFFIKLNEEFTNTVAIEPEVMAGMSAEEVKALMYNPQRHAAAVDGARKIAVRDCVAIDANCGMSSEQKSRSNSHRH